jgi:gamma-glutamyltranspeptidase/glutathione hydrolase
LVLLAQIPQAAAQYPPNKWTKQDLEHYLQLQYGLDAETRKKVEPPKSAEGSRAMIAGTSEPFAVHAGLEVLRHGGNAADAALATSLAQVALTAGAAISYAGILTAVYYDAASGKVSTLNATYNTVRNETDPLSIPGMGRRSGRTALVPGFMAGVQALHDRFGKLPFPALFGPAIWIADHGFAINSVVGSWIRTQSGYITQCPEGLQLFSRPDGSLYTAGDTFRQPQLAATLRKVAAEGSAYMYRGEWARHFVDIVQREGGKMTMEDLAAYRATWTEPIEVSYDGYRVVSLGLPSTGGLLTLGSLKVAEAGGLKNFGHYKTSADALYYLIQIGRVETEFANMPRNIRAGLFPGIDMSPTSQIKPDTAARLWTRIQSRMLTSPTAAKPAPGHSAGVLAVDTKGNVACVLHTLNGTLWGTSGIFVDGVSIPDSASFQQTAVFTAGRGARLPESTNPVLVLKGNKPVLASVAIGAGLHPVTLENLINVLDFGMDPKTAVDQPNTRGPYFGPTANVFGSPDFGKEAINMADFPSSVLQGVEARGQGIKIVETYAQPGYWIGIQIERKMLKGGVTPLLPGLVEGY